MFDLGREPQTFREVASILAYAVFELTTRGGKPLLPSCKALVEKERVVMHVASREERAEKYEIEFFLLGEEDLGNVGVFVSEDRRTIGLTSFRLSRSNNPYHFRSRSIGGGLNRSDTNDVGIVIVDAGFLALNGGLDL